MGGRSGRVSVEGLRGDALTATHTVETSYANILFVWPSSAGGPSFRLERSYGRATSDFPGSSEERGSRQIAEGEGSSASLELTSRNGNVTLRRQ